MPETAWYAVDVGFISFGVTKCLGTAQDVASWGLASIPTIS